MNNRMLVLVALGVACVGVPASRAFESNLPGHRIHEAVTREAAAAEGFEPRVIDSLVDAVNDPDYDETRLVDLRPGRPWILSPNDDYRAAHHFDRGPGDSHRDAFRAGAAYLRDRTRAALEIAAGGAPRRALASLGQALHALQDFFSHSNYVDLPSDAQERCMLALWDENREPPDGLRITAFFPGHRHPDAPPDPFSYTHAEHSKDAPDSNADAAGRPGGPSEPTRHELALAAAVTASRALLIAVRARTPESGPVSTD